MFFFFSDNKSVQIELGNSPKQADMAIVSIDINGTIGFLNEFVLKEYGYSKEILNNLNLNKGFDLFQLNSKPILFVVTVDQGNTENNLKNNLRQALTINFDSLSRKKIWIPLMGTGTGGLSHSESYNIITSLLEELKDSIHKFNCEFIISIPKNDEGIELFKNLEKKNNRNKVIDDILEEDNNYNGLEPISKIKKLRQKKNQPEKSESLQERKFWFVDSQWGSLDKSNDFYKGQIWEYVYGIESYFEKIKGVQAGDILINKTIIDNRLSVKGIGIVSYNPNDGKTINVNWVVVKKKYIDLGELIIYDHIISEASKNVSKTILKQLSIKEISDLNKVLSTILLKTAYNSLTNIVDINLKDGINKSNITTLAGLVSDTENGEDHLDIKKDVNAFARVIAAKSFEPPLAIALLGKWGSGKSFFMRKLKDGIQNLSLINPGNQFCEGIAHVHFNAWSYMDANLWASIVTRIFEGLNEYINNDTKANSFKKEIEKKLTQNLNIAKEEITTLEKQNENIIAQIDKLTQEKKTAEDNLKEKIQTIRKATIKAIIDTVDKNFKVSEQIDTALKNNETFVNSTERLKKIIPEQYWMNPNELYKKIKSKYTFIKTFFYGENWWKNCLWLTGFLVVFLYTPIFTFISTLLLSWQDFTLTPKTWKLITIVGTALVRGIDTYKKLKTLIAPFWKIKVDYETEKENVISQFNQQEKALKIEIENSKNEITVINEQISKANVIKTSIEFKLENALSTEALYSFIEKRANSEDYKKHLGIVSIIRKDFEVLSDLLVDHKNEASKNLESQEFKEMFSKPLERIILYIDDLDRCPEERVVEVLEAVNLLMAFPLFVVVVGVDPRWVKNALIKKHHLQFAGNDGDSGLEIIDPSSYLEKIFQVPFHLKDASDISIKNMIGKLAKTKVNLVPIKIQSQDVKNLEEVIDIDKIIPEEDDNVIDNTILIDTIKLDNLLNIEQIKALDISDEEIEQIKNLTEIIGNNPRAVKRFVNIYRIVKTHEDFDMYGTNHENKLHAIMFLLALSIGKLNKFMEEFERLISIPSYSSYTLKNIKVNLPVLFKAVENNQSIMNLSYKDIAEHYQFIKRFTFKNI
jgi:hypothetical protein